MAPDTERELLEKVNDIHGYLFGVMGQPGSVQRTETRLDNHDRRLGRLEKWSLLLLGGGSVIVFFVKVWASTR